MEDALLLGALPAYYSDRPAKISGVEQELSGMSPDARRAALP